MRGRRTKHKFSSNYDLTSLLSIQIVINAFYLPCEQKTEEIFIVWHREISQTLSRDVKTSWRLVGGNREHFHEWKMKSSWGKFIGIIETIDFQEGMKIYAVVIKWEK